MLIIMRTITDWSIIIFFFLKKWGGILIVIQAYWTEIFIWGLLDPFLSRWYRPTYVRGQDVLYHLHILCSTTVDKKGDVTEVLRAQHEQSYELYLCIEMIFRRMKFDDQGGGFVLQFWFVSS